MRRTVSTVFNELTAAAERLSGHVRMTPVRHSRFLSEAIDGEVYLKLEHLQVTGSFKVRGALNKLIPLKGSRRHIVAASTGNHALAVAHACTTLGLDCTLFLPESANRHKVAVLRGYPVELCFVGGDAVNAEHEARRMAEEQQQVFVSPYNDVAVIGGQGTVGTEILEQAPYADCVLVAVGGGGLVSGIGVTLKEHCRKTRIVGCSPAASCVMYESVLANRVVSKPSKPTLSDGTAGGLEDSTVTLELCREIVDDWLLISEREIAIAMRRLYDHHALTVEGAAAVAVAGLLKHTRHFANCRAAIVLCGGNVDPDTFSSILAST